MTRYRQTALLIHCRVAGILQVRIICYCFALMHINSRCYGFFVVRYQFDILKMQILGAQRSDI